MHTDRDADFAAFVEARWGVLVRSGVFLGCSLDDARDLAQTALLRCYLKWPHVTGADDPDAYVYRVLVNCLRDSKRRRWRHERPTADLPESLGESQEATAVLNDAVARALAALSEVQRQVVVLRHLVGLSEAQTATVLGVPPGTVKSRLSRGLVALAGSPHLTDFASGGPA